MVKVFCVGFNKTGTTSLQDTFGRWKFGVAPTINGTMLLQEIKCGIYKGLIDLCNKNYNFYQDVPFSLPGIYKIIHEHFPDAKFILLTRDSDAWWHSIKTFHKLLFSKDGTDLTEQKLRSSGFAYKGFIWDYYNYTFQPETGSVLYDRNKLVKVFEQHNHDVTQYFCGSPNFISIDISKSTDYDRLCTFMNIVPSLRTTFPHKNRTVVPQSSRPMARQTSNVKSRKRTTLVNSRVRKSKAPPPRIPQRK